MTLGGTPLRRSLSPALLLACLFLAAPAHARVESKEVSQSASSVAGHWTQARMRAATPADRTAAGAQAKAAPAQVPWSSSEVTTPYSQQPPLPQPAPPPGKVFFTLAGVDYVCSGTALLSSNKSVVWTAGHCVNEGPGDFATNWEFVPAYKDGTAPLGVYVAEDLVTSSAWANSGDFSYDFAAAVVAPSGGTALTDRVGGRGITFNYSRNQTYSAYGYPAAPPFAGERLWVCNSTLQTSDTSANPPTMGIGCDMTG